MDILEILDSNGRRRQVRLERPRLLIGRDASCDVCLPHPNISRRHAQLQRTGQNTWLLQDLNSLNHIYCNDEVVQQVILEPGKQVRIGEYSLALREMPTVNESESPSRPSLEDSAPSWPGLEPGWLEQLQQFQRSLLHLEQPEQVLERLGDEFQRVARAQGVAIGLVRPDGYRWEITSGAAEFRDPTHLNEACQHISGEDSEVRCWSQGAQPGETASIHAAYCLLFPMRGRAGTLGHVYVLRPRQVPLPAAQLRYLSLYANYAGLMWENLQVNALKLAQRQLEQQIRQARQIQTELFPVSFDVDPRLNAYAVNLPSVHISGDYYDLIKTGPDTLVFVIADAMGHGIPAALTMAVFSSTLRMGLTVGLDWEALFRGLDAAVGHGHFTRFVTGVLGRIDLSRKELEIVVAGHDAPSILLAGEPVVVPPGCRSRPWGLDLPASWEVGRVPLGSADWSILCFTDGIKDARTGPNDSFGVPGVQSYHLEFRHTGAEDLCQGLVGAVARQAHSATLADDQTVLVLRSPSRRPVNGRPTPRDGVQAEVPRGDKET